MTSDGFRSAVALAVFFKSKVTKLRQRKPVLIGVLAKVGSSFDKTSALGGKALDLHLHQKGAKSLLLSLLGMAFFWFSTARNSNSNRMSERTIFVMEMYHAMSQ